MELGMRGKVVIVTGGSRGIGKATVMDFAREGCKVAFSAREESALQTTAKRLTPWGPKRCQYRRI